MTVLLPGLPDLVELGMLIIAALTPDDLLGSYTFPDGSTDWAIAVEGLGHDEGEEAYPPTGTQVEGLEVAIVPAEEIPVQDTLDGYIQTYRTTIVLKQHDASGNKTLRAFRALQRQFGNIFEGSVSRLLPTERLGNIETLAFQLEHSILIELDEMEGMLETAEPSPQPSDSGFRVAFSWGDASPKPIYLAAAGTSIFTATVVIQTPFNGVGTMLTLGDARVSDRLMRSDQNDPTFAAEYEANPGWSYSTNSQILLTITPGAGCTQGSGYILLEV